MYAIPNEMDGTEMSASSLLPGTDRLRTVLGRYPTGVSIVTGLRTDGTPVGLALGTFTSVSLDPLLVGFLPAKSSQSWPKIRAAGLFCINVLGEHQQDICRRFAVSGGDKFKNLEWRAPGPVPPFSMAWGPGSTARSKPSTRPATMTSSLAGWTSTDRT